MRQGMLQELQGAARLTRGFFNSLIRRIECTKPIAGNGISIVQKDDGIQINLGGGNDDGGGGGLVTYDLTVCENGQTKTIQVYGPAPSDS